MPDPQFYREFMNMLDRVGLSPVGEKHEVMHKERQLMAVLNQVEDFGVRRLAEIEKWIRDCEADGYPIRKVNRVIEEIKARMAHTESQAKDEEPAYDDDFIRDYYMRLMNRTPEGEHKERYRKVCA